MADTLSFPFRLAPNGAPVTVEVDSDAHYMDLLVALAMTRPGERHLVPEFGVNDPVFDEFDGAALVAAAAAFGPPVEIDGVSVSYVDETTEEIVVTFH